MKSEYRAMPLKKVKEILPMAEKLNVSKVARGRGGFVSAMKKAGSVRSMSDDWQNKRENFIARHIVQYNNRPTIRRKLALMVWAYNPDYK